MQQRYLHFILMYNLFYNWVLKVISYTQQDIKLGCIFCARARYYTSSTGRFPKIVSFLDWYMAQAQFGLCTHWAGPQPWTHCQAWVWPCLVLTAAPCPGCTTGPELQELPVWSGTCSISTGLCTIVWALLPLPGLPGVLGWGTACPDLALLAGLSWVILPLCPSLGEQHLILTYLML